MSEQIENKLFGSTDMERDFPNSVKQSLTNDKLHHLDYIMKSKLQPNVREGRKWANRRKSINRKIDLLSYRNLSSLPDYLKSKFDQLQEPMHVGDQTELLTWFVDNMRVEVLKYFEENQLIQEMSEEDRSRLVNEVNECHHSC